MSSLSSRILAAVLITAAAYQPAAARELRVCADPNNLPYSRADGSGFENALAQLISRELRAHLSYTWHASRRGFLRNTLKAGACDVVIGVPVGFEGLETTRPYYRSSYVFVQRHGSKQISSYDDPALRRMRIGVQLVGDDGANTPPVHQLAARGIVGNVKGYSVFGDYRTPAPLRDVVDGVANGDTDVAIVWGPIAGYFALRPGVHLVITPIDTPRTAAIAETFDIAVGVRREDRNLAHEIDLILHRHKHEVERVLRRFGVPHYSPM